MVKAAATVTAKKPEGKVEPAIRTIIPKKEPATRISSVPVEKLVEPGVIQMTRPVGSGEGALPPEVVNAELVRAMKQGYKIITAHPLGLEPNRVDVYYCLVRQ